MPVAKITVLKFGKMHMGNLSGVASVQKWTSWRNIDKNKAIFLCISVCKFVIVLLIPYDNVNIVLLYLPCCSGSQCVCVIQASQYAQRESQELFQCLFFRGRGTDDDKCVVDAIVCQLRANGVMVFVPRQVSSYK